MVDPKRSSRGGAGNRVARGKRSSVTSKAGRALKSAASTHGTPAARSAEVAEAKKVGTDARRARIDRGVLQLGMGLVTVDLPQRVVEDELRRAQNLKIPIRADLVAKALGSRAELAKVLRVSPSQPTRWIKGQETPNSENTRAIVDLEHVVARARMLWADDDVVNTWLTSSNGFLDGARPVDVITTQGSSPVIDALDQVMSGAFA